MIYTEPMADLVKKLLRLPSDLLAELTEWAGEEDRSVNSLIVHVLRRAVADRRRSRTSEYRYPDTSEHATGRLLRAAEN